MEAGHHFCEIPEYTLQQAVMLLAAAERNEAARRASFVTDMIGVVSAAFGTTKTLQTHLDSLLAARDEEDAEDGES